jgi:hypothetical protein
METLWSEQAENDMTGIFCKLDARLPLEVNEKDTLVRFLAIHYVRSEEFIKVYEKVRDNKCRTTNFDASLPFDVRYRLRLDLLKETVIPSQFFEDTMRDKYMMCVKYLDRFGFEIGVAVEKETLILPDGGLLLADEVVRRTQPSDGVTLTGATHAVMPLGPRHLIAFTAKSKGAVYRELSDEQVKRANSNLELAVIKAYFRQPV